MGTNSGSQLLFNEGYTSDAAEHGLRAPARFDGDGAVALLDEQDRSLWDKALIAEVPALVDKALRHR